ncbi:MAG TPA: threonine synthase [Candidatus Limiplasma sp.]|nr:threonine synthase [Candidatus Limiplasma sp.]
MSFYSTRGGACVTASQAILWGLAKDGGLYVPSMFPQLPKKQIFGFCDQSYQKIAQQVLSSFLEDYSKPEITQAVEAAYSPKNFDDPAIAPLRQLDDRLHVMELFHGPTIAFKDIALQLLPYLVRLAAEKNDEQREISIMVATSGDTGKAALEGFKDVKGTSCTVFYPHDGVSDMQRLQMVTTEGGNTHVIGVKGNFDDAQTGVKKLFSSEDFREKMNALGKMPSSANSINFGRLVPQVVYYFYAYAQLVCHGKLRMGQPLNFVVPTGNFGDILAGYYAKRMGLPVGKLICASNRNNVLSDFFTDGVYYTHRTFFKTISPSMDILISSNLERLLYESAGRNAKVVKEWMESLMSSGSFSIGMQRLEELKQTFEAGFADDLMTREEIKRVYEHTGYLLDPHTAVASHVQREYHTRTGDFSQTVILATASPYKFAADVLAALQGEQAVASLDAFACAQKLQEYSGAPIPKQITALKALPVRHKTVCKIDDMQKTMLKELKA